MCEVILLRGGDRRTIQFNSVQSLDWLGLRGVHVECVNRDSLPAFSVRGHHEQVLHRQRYHRLFGVVHPAFLCRPRNTSPTLQYALKDGSGELSWRVTCPNHASFRLLTIVWIDFCWPTRKLILFCTQRDWQTDIIGAQRHRQVYTETLRDRDDNYDNEYKIWLTLIVSDVISSMIGKDTCILRFTNVLRFSR